MDLPKHYKLLKEHEKHFEIHDERDGKSFKVAKRELHPAHQLKIMKMEKKAFGGVSGDEGEDGPEEGVSTAGAREEAPSQETPASIAQPPNDSPNLLAQYDQPLDTGLLSPVPHGQGQPNANPGQAAISQAQSRVPTSAELDASIKQRTEGAGAEASAMQLQNESLAKQYKKNNDADQAYMYQQAAKMDGYQKQYDQMAADISSTKIDPNKYWHDKSTGSKVAAVIGLMLGGVGAGLTHGPNVGLQMLQKGIDNDIESQKSNLGKKQSLLSDNLRMQGNLLAATNATRLQMSAMAQGRLMQVAAQTGNPIIAARAQQKAAEIAQSTIPLRQQVANNEVQMAVRSDVLHRLSAQGQPGVPEVDMHDLSRAGLVDKATAEKEQASISKRQQAEAYAIDQAKKLSQEQTVGLNLINPESYNRRDQFRAGIIQAIQSASPSKRLNPEVLAMEVEPYLTKTLQSQETRESGLNGILGLIRSHADPTPMATHYKIPGAINQKNTNPKSFDLGPVK